MNAGVIRLEGSRTKNGEPRVIPLSQPALDLLSELPRVRVGEGKDERDSPFVFTTTGLTYSSIVSDVQTPLLG